MARHENPDQCRIDREDDWATECQINDTKAILPEWAGAMSFDSRVSALVDSRRFSIPEAIRTISILDQESA